MICLFASKNFFLTKCEGVEMSFVAVRPSPTRNFVQFSNSSNASFWRTVSEAPELRLLIIRVAEAICKISHACGRLEQVRRAQESRGKKSTGA